MFFSGTTVPGGASENEDWLAATPDLIVVLDGATVRTETGCHHGPAWYTRKLGAAIIASAADRNLTLSQVLANAIVEVAKLHPQCDLKRPGAPSAGAAIVRQDGNILRYIALGDVSIVLKTDADVEVVSDERVSATARAERAEADRYLIGEPEKAAALVRMKEAELAAQNQEGGYWIAAANPAAVEHALVGQLDIATITQIAVLSDGAARLVKDFKLASWDEVIELLASSGPHQLIKRVREVEEDDPLGEKYRRNKKSDDATAVYARI
ncbi:protein phosphatase 2C domain-containing protein [Amycolatopsis australiensis]|uniref:Protein phosphatase 2C n=1 Tax=Amycolatopsis australiensis TaxID=546364 RepID=A0A1K1LQB9_9PSEU|nr:protein phosphatase 2C domain-containing protein [Amycolatopsis australiensis]SFW11854.1 Protein phosphatase 2C [Amycolatopsis australiensis]